MSIEYKKLTDCVVVAELWHGKTGTAEDYTGSEIPGGYIRVIQEVYQEAVSLGLCAKDSSVDFAVHTSLWVSACLQAKQAGLPIRFIVCPFASMPWRDEAILPIPVSKEDGDAMLRTMFQEQGYLLYPRTAAAAAALKSSFQKHQAAPSILLATEHPQHSRKEIDEIISGL